MFRWLHQSLMVNKHIQFKKEANIKENAFKMNV